MSPNVRPNASDRTTTRRAYLRTVGVGAAAVGVSALAGCAGSSGDQSVTPSVDADETVKVGPSSNQTSFVPGTDKPLRVSKGDLVLWIWESDNHNIVVGSQPDGANWEGTAGGPSKVYDAGHQYHYKFTVPGKYHYWCQPHKSLGMVADIIVEN